MAGLIDAIKSDLLPLVAKAAPLLAGALGTPLAGVAVSLIANEFGVNPKNLDEVVKAVKETPESALRMKTLEYTHNEALASINSHDYETEVDDRKDAREMAKILDNKEFLRSMTYIVTGGFFGALILLFCPIPINPGGRELLSMLVGMLVSKWQTIIDFFFGSSSRKTK